MSSLLNQDNKRKLEKESASLFMTHEARHNLSIHLNLFVLIRQSLFFLKEKEKEKGALEIFRYPSGSNSNDKQFTRHELSTYHFAFSFASSLCRLPLVFCKVGDGSLGLPWLCNS